MLFNNFTSIKQHIDLVDELITIEIPTTCD